MDHSFSEHYSTGREATHGHFVLGVLAALTMAVIGTIIWIGIALMTGWHPGPLALLIAVMIGVSVRVSGRGSHFIFGVVGITFTLLSCMTGEIGVSLQLATTPWFDFYGVLTRVDLFALASVLIRHMTPMMMIIYGVSSYVAYSLSIVTRK